MSTTHHDAVLQEAFYSTSGTSLWIKRAVLVALGIAILAIAAKIRVPMWPVPITMGTFAVLTIGAAYGPKLGLTTIMGYMLIGAFGFDVFASSTAENNGLAYMLGGSGGYLLGYVLATAALGYLARLGWDRTALKMGGALLIGNALIYIPGLLWLNGFAESWAQTFQWGLTPFLIGDAIKLALAALLIPAIWKFVGSART